MLRQLFQLLHIPQIKTVFFKKQAVFLASMAVDALLPRALQRSRLRFLPEFKPQSPSGCRDIRRYFFFKYKPAPIAAAANKTALPK